MNESTLEIRTPDGVMPTFTACPRDGGPFPVVIIYMDVWGVREELFDIARRVASVGYYCVVPDLYYRQGRVRNAFRNGSVATTGTALAKVLPPVSRFSPGGERSKKRESVLDKLTNFFEKFFDISNGKL